MNETLDSTRPVRPGEELNVPALESYLLSHLPGFAGSLTVEQFPHGHSNLTYLLKADGHEWVLRRPPFGNQVKSAHDMEREYRVLSRLSKVYPPAPAPYLYCGDDAVLGAPFYVMERRFGVVIRKQQAPGHEPDPSTLRRLCQTLVDNLALLHSIDPEAAGLGGLGKPVGYVERQVSGWTERYQNARSDDVADLEHVMAWLAQNRPPESGTALIHNDYKFDNVVLDAVDPTRIVAVLDWEMATVGDPLMDLGTTLGYWIEAGDPEPLRAVAFGPTSLPGALTRVEVAERYAERTRRDLPPLLFYYVYGLFKIAVIVQQIYARYVRGLTHDERFRQMNQVVALLGRQAARAIEREQLD